LLEELCESTIDFRIRHIHWVNQEYSGKKLPTWSEYLRETGAGDYRHVPEIWQLVKESYSHLMEAASEQERKYQMIDLQFNTLSSRKTVNAPYPARTL